LKTFKKICQVKKSLSPTIWHNFTKACLLRCKITHTHRLQSPLIQQNKVTMRSYLHDAICKITHTDYSHHWYIRTRLQCGHIFMTRYAKSHTQITVIIDTSEQGYNAAISSWRDMQNHTHTSILLHVVIEQAPFLLMA
jgi:hypothetical protein